MGLKYLIPSSEVDFTLHVVKAVESALGVECVSDINEGKVTYVVIDNVAHPTGTFISTLKGNYALFIELKGNKCKAYTRVITKDSLRRVDYVNAELYVDAYTKEPYIKVFGVFMKYEDVVRKAFKVEEPRVRYTRYATMSDVCLINNEPYICETCVDYNGVCFARLPYSYNNVNFVEALKGAFKEVVYVDSEKIILKDESTMLYIENPTLVNITPALRREPKRVKCNEVYKEPFKVGDVFVKVFKDHMVDKTLMRVIYVKGDKVYVMRELDKIEDFTCVDNGNVVDYFVI